MKNQEQFVKSIDILVDAYEKGNLQHMSPCNCAVGNLIAYNTGEYDRSNKTGSWVHLVNLIRQKSITDIHPNSNGLATHFQEVKHIQGVNSKNAFESFAPSGYNALEIEKIEAAFEKCEINKFTKLGSPNRGANREDNPLEGLLRAVSVLGEIHEIPEEVLVCMKDKIQNKTYVKSFEFETPKDNIESLLDEAYIIPPEGPSEVTVSITCDAFPNVDEVV